MFLRIGCNGRNETSGVTSLLNHTQAHSYINRERGRAERSEQFIGSQSYLTISEYFGSNTDACNRPENSLSAHRTHAGHMVEGSRTSVFHTRHTATEIHRGFGDWTVGIPHPLGTVHVTQISEETLIACIHSLNSRSTQHLIISFIGCKYQDIPAAIDTSQLS